MSTETMQEFLDRTRALKGVTYKEVSTNGRWILGYTTRIDGHFIERVISGQIEVFDVGGEKIQSKEEFFKKVK